MRLVAVKVVPPRVNAVPPTCLAVITLRAPMATAEEPPTWPMKPNVASGPALGTIASTGTLASKAAAAQ